MSGLVRQALRPIGVAMLIIVLALVDLTVHNTFGWAGHVTWAELGHFNRAAFDKQLRAALPIGTPKSAVEAYLKREGIPFQYDMRRFLAEQPYDIRVLRIKIDLDRDLKVSGVDVYDFLYK